ncbi:hypothetical protein [Nitrospirillum sp. BR 11163]|nr:hypothetical protein [Nitrospirillum sp. BR 11163]MEA1675305.1 hypothetical protein [Nitrospirillum sp. BR 11163]
MKASGLTPEEFKVIQKTVSRLRDNLLVHAGASQANRDEAERAGAKAD